MSLEDVGKSAANKTERTANIIVLEISLNKAGE